MSDFKHYDEEADDLDLLYDEDFDADTFIGSMDEDGADPTLGTTRRMRQLSAREMLERRSEERWLREQLEDFDEYDPLH
jgi:hypothetical protein